MKMRRTPLRQRDPNQQWKQYSVWRAHRARSMLVWLVFARCLFDAGVSFVIFSFDVRLMFVRKVFRLHFSFSDASFGDGFRSDRPVARFFPFSIRSMPPKLDLKKTSPIWYVLLLQVAPHWAISMVYPTSLRWHPDAINTMLTTFWRIWLCSATLRRKPI